MFLCWTNEFSWRSATKMAQEKEKDQTAGQEKEAARLLPSFDQICTDTQP